MIWFRRIIALPLALLFIILSLLVLVTFRVSDTLGNPDFYNEQLRQADIYNFIYDDLLPTALAEAEVTGDISKAGIDVSRLEPYLRVIYTWLPLWLGLEMLWTGTSSLWMKTPPL